MTALEQYRKARHEAETLPSSSGYDLSKGEMNPEIVKRFAAMCKSGGWAFEPFSNPDGRNIPIFKDNDIKLIAYSLVSSNPEVIVKDGTIYGPAEHEPEAWAVDGVLFHPPYFGSAPLSSEEGEMSLITDEEAYRIQLQTAADVSMHYLGDDGRLCAVGRRYRHNGKEIRMDEWIIEVFSQMEVVEVWISEPDVAIILRF